MEEAVNTFRGMLEFSRMINRKPRPSHRNRYDQDRDHQEFHYQPGFPGVRGVLRYHAKQSQNCIGGAG
jgi:hypothetical protein